MTYVDKIKQYGTKRWCHLTADTMRELYDMARRLRELPKIGGKGKEPHLDLTEHQRELALRYGAVELDESRGSDESATN